MYRQRYQKMLTDYWIPALNETNISNHFVQHTTRPNMEILRAKFPGNLITRIGDVEWPARSPDLSPFDYFFWAYLKGNVYRNEPTNIAQLKAAIQGEIELITPELTSRAISNLRNRAKCCLRSGGQHMKDIILKK